MNWASVFEVAMRLVAVAIWLLCAWRLSVGDMRWSLGGAFACILVALLLLKPILRGEFDL